MAAEGLHTDLCYMGHMGQEIGNCEVSLVTINGKIINKTNPPKGTRKPKPRRLFARLPLTTILDLLGRRYG